MRLERVGKRYGIRRPWVVRDVTAEIPPGALIRLDGVNGSGKSTLLRLIAGVSEPSSGTVTGRPRTGYVPERFPPALPFTARDYLSHLGRMHGLSRPELPVVIDEWLDRLGGGELAGIRLRTMSKGMCQKVAVAQALLARPGLLVLDEAWTGLDKAARAALDSAVTERVADGGSVVFVDHDLERLAGQHDQRWTVASRRISVAAGTEPARDQQDGAAGAVGATGPEDPR